MPRLPKYAVFLLLLFIVAGCKRSGDKSAVSIKSQMKAGTIESQRAEFLKEKISEFNLQSKSDRDAFARIVSQNFTPQIVGGIRASDNQFPWQVALWSVRFKSFRFCSGSLINPRWVLTAAHCVCEEGTRTPNDLAVFAGTADLEARGKVIAVEKVIVHPDWKPEGLQHDLALLRLKASRPISDVIPLVPDAEEPALTAPGETGVVSGWGYTLEGGPSSSILRYTGVPFVSQQTCNEPQSYGGVVTNDLLCAGDRQRDSCNGDSGGPLMVQTRIREGQFSWALAGVVGKGVGCAREFKYGLYSRIASHHCWINQTMQTNPAPLACPGLH